jgi:hypothetical protein
MAIDIIYIAIAIAIAIATQKKAATKATTSLPTPLYQWMDDFLSVSHP